MLTNNGSGYNKTSQKLVNTGRLIAMVADIAMGKDTGISEAVETMADALTVAEEFSGDAYPILYKVHFALAKGMMPSGLDVLLGMTHNCEYQTGCAVHDKEAACVNTYFTACQTNEAGYSIKSGVVTECAKGKKNPAGSDDSEACTAACDKDENCEDENGDTTKACVGSAKDKFHCAAAKNGYYIRDGVPIQCAAQVGCSEHVPNAACVDTKYVDGIVYRYKRCKDQKNEAGYSIKAGVVTRCKHGKKMPAAQADASHCSAACDKHAQCRDTNGDSSKLCPGNAKDKFHCKVARAGWFITHGVPTQCTTQEKCKTHNATASCVGSNKQQCTALQDNLKGYFLDGGLVKQCIAQVGCTEHEAAATCVNTKYQKCKAQKNAAGFSIKAGVVTVCATGKKMAAAQADADGCTANCDKHAQCHDTNNDNSKACIGSAKDKFHCNAAKGGYYLVHGAPVQCVAQAGCSQHDPSKACVNTKFQRCKDMKNNAGYSIKAGVVKRCAQGKTMAANSADASSCATSCTHQADCHKHFAKAACVGSGVDKQKCTALKHTAKGKYINAGLVVQCEVQGAKCKTHDASKECVGSSKDKQMCTALKDGLHGYYLNEGLVSQCHVQVGCTEHDATAACVNTKYQKCKAQKNAAGFSIKGGVVKRCATGKKMAAAQADADGCTASCDQHLQCKTKDSGKLCLGIAKDKFHCKEAKDGYYLVDGVPTQCATQVRCKTHAAGAACVGSNQQKCTALADGLKGYYISSGLVTQCHEQDGCSEHDAEATCVSTTYQKCKARKNKFGYRIKSGIVYRCHAGKKMAAGSDDADACTAACDSDANCGDEAADTDKLCVGYSKDMFHCTTPKLGYYVTEYIGVPTRCAKQNKCKTHNPDVACVGNNQQFCEELEDDAQGFFLEEDKPGVVQQEEGLVGRQVPESCTWSQGKCTAGIDE
eukprot:COSAG05_NODE_1030_length_6093_cov_3.047881_2_plen_935_part_00